MAAYGRSWPWLAIAAALATAACGGSTAPQRSLLGDPQQLSSDLQTVSAIFATPVFKSFGAIGAAAGSPVAPAAPAGALLAAAPVTVQREPRQAYVDTPARLRALRLAARALTSPASANVIPDTLLGKTFEWDTTSHQYVVGPDSGPPNGVRIILYEVDPATQEIQSPLTAVGFVDLLDESSGSTNQLQVIVKSGTPGSPEATYADYTISATVTLNGSSVPSAFLASATGYVSDGARRLDFNASVSATNLDTDDPDAQIDVTWSLNSPAVSVALQETLATPDAQHVTLSIDFSVMRGSETVRLAGTLAVDDSLQTATANLTVYVDGQTFARTTGTATATGSTIQTVHADGTALSQDERTALAHLYQLPDDMFSAIEDLVSPAETLMGA